MTALRTRLFWAGLVATMVGATLAWVQAPTGRATSYAPIAFEQIFSPNPAVSDLITVNPDGSGSFDLTANGTGFSDHPAWIPGRRSLLYAYSATIGPNCPQPNEPSCPAPARFTGSHIFSVTADGKFTRKLTFSAGSETAPAIAPDGSLLAFEGYNGSTDAIFLSGPNGGGYSDFRQLTFPDFAAGGYDTDPAFSPDGSKIAFTRDDGPLSAIFVIGVEGTGLKQLTPYSLDGRAPRWSPDGKRIVFDTHEDGDTCCYPSNENIWVMNADGRNPKQLTAPADYQQYIKPDWSPDGSQIVFAHYSFRFGIFEIDVMNTDGSNPHAVYNSGVGLDDWPRWSTG